jgi:serine/threonine protein kinase
MTQTQLNSGPGQFSGTPTYMAQELFQKRAYSEAVDVFALGTLLYELYAGEVPYHGLDPADIKDRILKDSSLPVKGALRKPVTEISTLFPSQSTAAGRIRRRSGRAVRSWSSSVIGELGNKFYI